MKLLVAEDDIKLLKTLTHLFKINNYTVDGVDNGKDAFDFAVSGEYDGIILDIMMPEMDGLTVLKRLRDNGVTTPTLFLTAKCEVYQRIDGLDAGADDYVQKPFSTAELLARVRAMLRRKDNFVPDIVYIGDLVVNRSTYEISCGEKREPLSKKEFQLMQLLVDRAGNLVSMEQIITHIWGWDATVDTSVVWVHISNIRKKLEALGSKATISFLRNAGYMLEVNE